jgi:hypothetical protein
MGQIAEFDQAEHPGALNVLDSGVQTSSGFGVVWRDVASSSTGGVSTSDTQKYHVIRGGPSAPADVDTFVQMQAAIDPASLAATGDDPIDTRLCFAGQAFGTVAISQAASTTIEDVAHSNDGAGGDISIDLFVSGSLGINCGNPPGGFDSKYGVFDVDQDFSGGVADSSFYNSSGFPGEYVDTSQVYGANPQIYLTSRQGVGTGSFTYTIPGFTPSSSVRVRLHFSENHNVSAGQRLINVIAQGSPILTNFDIVATAGAIETAIARTFSVTADGSGDVVLVFSAAGGSALPCQVNAIEIVTSPPLINCGNPGDDTFPDINFSGGAVASTTAHLTDLSWVDRPLPQRMYQTARTGVCSYTLTGLLASALYCVRLHFCDFQSAHALDRVFGVNINTVAVESGLDLVATAGAPRLPYAVQHVVRSTAGGVIVIDLVAGAAGDPIINGIELSRLYDWMGYRYADIVVNDSTLGSQTMLLKLGSKHWSIETAAAATDVTRTIDLCSPDNRADLLSLGPQIDSQWPLPTADDVDPLWGVSVAWNLTATSLATGTTFQIKSITLKRVHDCLVTILPADQAWVPDGWGNQVTRGIVAVTDGRQSLEQEYMQRYMLKSDGTHDAEGHLYHKRNGDYLYRQLSIAQMVHRIGMQLGWTATFSGGDDFHNKWRPWVWAMGGGALWNDSGAGAWDSPFNLDGAAGVSVACQALWDFVSDWYPDVGDPFSAIGGDMPCRFFKRLRGNVWGLVMDNTGANVSGQSVQAEDLVPNPAGSGSTNAWGFYHTGTTFLVSTDFLDWENDHPIGAEPHTTLPYAAGDVQPNPPSMGLRDLVVIRSRKSTRAGFVLTPVVSITQPFNLETELEKLYRFAVRAGDVRAWFCEHSIPASSSGGWAQANVMVSHVGNAKTPRACLDHRGFPIVVYESAGTIYEQTSWDEAATWTDPVSRFTGAKWPVIAPAFGGEEIIRGCYETGNLIATEQWSGDASPSTQWTMQDAAGASLSVEDDSWQIVHVGDEPGRWYLHVRISGESSTSAWESTDDCRQWTRLGFGIAGGTRPSVSAGKMGEVLWTALVTVSSIQYLAASIQWPGNSTATAYPATLQLSDDEYGLSAADDTAGRYVLSAVRTGTTVPGELQTVDDGETWKDVL